MDTKAHSSLEERGARARAAATETDQRGSSGIGYIVGILEHSLPTRGRIERSFETALELPGSKVYPVVEQRVVRMASSRGRVRIARDRRRIRR